jgi:hypothetical protein
MSQELLDLLIPTLLAILTTIIGGIFGYALSEVAEQRRDARTAQRQAESLRLLLYLEAERNLEALRQGWGEVGHDPNEVYGEREKRDIAHRFLDQMPARFNREAFESQLGLMALLLPVEEIRRVFALYDRLAVIADYCASLREAKAAQQDEYARFHQTSAQVKPGGFVVGPRQPFDNYAAANWDKIAAAVSDTLAMGSPIAAVKGG